MFGWDQRQRLLRESWTANALSEEIFAMMSPDAPNDTQAPVKIDLPTGTTVAPIQLGNSPDGSPVFSITRPNGEPGPTISFGGGTFLVDGQPIVGSGGGGGGGGTPVWG